MKILVAVKRVVDYKTNIRLKSDGSGVETANVKMSMNPFDEIAVEEALRMKENHVANEIVLVSIGAEANQETLRTGLAMGADRGILVKSDLDIQPLAAAHILKAVAEQEKVDLIILGKQAIDSDNNQVGQMLAGLLNWPQGMFASKVVVSGQAVMVTREIDGGLETDKLTLPAVISTDLRLNEPRYISLPNIVKAKQKEIKILEAESLEVDLQPRIKILSVAMPRKQRAKIKIESVGELIGVLKREKQVTT